MQLSKDENVCGTDVTSSFVNLLTSCNPSLMYIFSKRCTPISPGMFFLKGQYVVCSFHVEKSTPSRIVEDNGEISLCCMKYEYECCLDCVNARPNPAFQISSENQGRICGPIVEFNSRRNSTNYALNSVARRRFEVRKRR